MRAERDAILGSEQVLRQELEQCRVMLSQREAECETLRAENSDMVWKRWREWCSACFVFMIICMFRCKYFFKNSML